MTMTNEFNQTVIGKVIDRNAHDLSITLQPFFSGHQIRNGKNIIVNLCHWLQQFEVAHLRKLLPCTNMKLRICNVKLLHSAAADGDVYIANATTQTFPLCEDWNPLLDELIAVETFRRLDNVTEIADYSGNFHILQILEENKLSMRHLEMYLKLPNSLPRLKLFNLIRIVLFKCMAEAGTVGESRLPPLIFTATTIRRIDTDLKRVKRNKSIYFGNKPSQRHECMVGIFTTRLGKFYLDDDAGGSIVMRIRCDHSSELLRFFNTCVFIRKFHLLSETYPDGFVECLVVDVDDMRVWAGCIDALFEPCAMIEECMALSDGLRIVANKEELPYDSRTYVAVQFDVQLIAPVSLVYSRDELEIWLQVRGKPSNATMMLSLNTHYLSTAPFLDTGRTYTLYLPCQLERALMHPEIKRLGCADCFALKSPHAYFVAGDFVADGFRVTSAPSIVKSQVPINLQATIVDYYLTPITLTSRSAINPFVKNSQAIGMFGRHFDRRFILSVDGKSYPMYANNWEMKQPPEGLHPHAVAIITNVVYNGRYFLSNIFTNICVIGVDDKLKKYSSANLNDNNKAYADYGSLAIPTADSSFKFNLYIRTRAYLKSITATWCTSTRSFHCRLVVADDRGTANIECHSYKILYKLMNVVDNEKMLKYGMLTKCRNKVICLSKYEEMFKETDCSPFLHLWLQHCCLKLNHGIFNVDILCKRIAEKSWCLMDVFAVNDCHYKH